MKMQVTRATPPPKLNIYVMGHASLLNDTFTPGRNTYFFKSELGQCAVGDATNIDVNPNNYVKDISYRSQSTSRDYIIDFVDEVQTYSFQTFGVFVYEQLPDKKNGKYIDKVYDGQTNILLSNIVSDFNNYNTGGNQYFLHICRTPEQSSSHEQEPNVQETDDDFAELASNVFYESPSQQPSKKSKKKVKSGSRKQRKPRKQNKKSRRTKTKKDL